MYLLIKNDGVLEKYNKIWDKISNSIRKRFDREPVHNEKYLKAKMKSYEGKINTNFNGEKLPKKGSQYICLLVILIDSVFRTGKNYYPLFSEECKHIDD